jgi:hypothetical protein
LGIELKQINVDDWIGHGKVIDRYLRECNQDWEYLLLLDIDCIPLNKEIVPKAIDWAKNNNGIFSVAQKASHIKGSIEYASPAFLTISQKTYNFLGRPTFSTTERSDCAAELSYHAKDKGVELNLLYPSSVEVELWDLDNGRKFGFGTTYDNQVYHAFESRLHKTTDSFVKKCNEVIK